MHATTASSNSPTPRLRKHETRANLHWFNWNASLRAVFDTFCGGTTFMFVAFALSLGVPSEKIGYITAVTAAACVLQLLGIALAERVRDKRTWVVLVGVLEPALFIAAVLAVPMMPPAWRLPVLGMAIIGAAACLHMTRPLADEWLASSIPGGLRGKYLGRRTQILSSVVLLTTLIAGYAGEWAGKRTVPLAIVLGAAGLFGLAAVLSLRRATLPAVSAQQAFRWKDVRSVRRHPAFIRCVIVLTLYNIPFFFAVPYYQVFNLDVLKMSTTQIAYMSAGYLLCKIMLSRPLGQLIDRWGERRALLLCGAVYFFCFSCFPLCGLGYAKIIIVAWAGFSVADSLWTIGANKVMFAALPGTASRATYMAVLQLVQLSVNVVCSTLAVSLLKRLRDVHWHWGPLTLDQYHIYYGCAVVMLLPASLTLLLVPKHTAANAMNTQRQQ